MAAAGTILQRTAEVVAQDRLRPDRGGDGLRMRLHCPDIAGVITAGRFVNVSPLPGPPAEAAMMLRRPMSLYRVTDRDGDPDGERTCIEIIYAVVGDGTAALSRARPGDRLDLLGPLGRPWGATEDLESPAGHVFVAGGVGVPPFMELALEMIRAGRDPSTILMLFGARSAGMLYDLDAFLDLGLDVRPATDDGSEGHHGLVTDLLPADLSGLAVWACGPTPMLRAVQHLCTEERPQAARPVLCRLSLEEHMACGFGVCRGCPVRRVTDDGALRYSMICLEGPVFDADTITFDNPEPDACPPAPAEAG